MDYIVDCLYSKNSIRKIKGEEEREKNRLKMKEGGEENSYR